MTLPQVPETLIRDAIVLIGTEGLEEQELDSRLEALTSNASLAKRLKKWIPEAFGHMTALQIAAVILPKEFQARNEKGQWKVIPLSSEPIYAAALAEAHEMFNRGSRETHLQIAMRSACLNSVNNALNNGANIDGAVISGPAMLDIPAETYQAIDQKEPSFWNKLWRRG